jgi:hypothetical protein
MGDPSGDRNGNALTMTSKKENPEATAEWLPDPKDVIEEIDVHSPESGDFKIQRTNIVDPYDEPLPPAQKKPQG